ncbi:MAG: efflux RND transporter permease subunit, partial [Rhodocyclaceae bacterium]|nr:efflux RND transporter permease subunit [Rhodocyclaceae bacterium]
MNNSFNLSGWALSHPRLVRFFMVLVLIAGVQAYFGLGRAEDPDFTFKVMVVRTLWPGAGAGEVERELTDRVEKKLYDTPWVDFVSSVSRPGESLVFVTLLDYTPKAEVPESWRQVRRRLEDIRQTLPAGVQGPFPNEEFGDVMVNIVALTADGHDLAELRRQAEDMARELRRVPDVRRVELLGVQEEKIFVEISPRRLATLGLTPRDLADALDKQNGVADGGFVETDDHRLRLRVGGAFDSLDSVREALVTVNGRQIRVADIAQVSRGHADPPTPRMRVDGKPAIGIGVVMNKGGDVIHLGENLAREIRRLGELLPVGIDIHTVADQPHKVEQSIRLFVTSLGEAIAIILVVSFLSLGWRTGTVVALSIPVVLAITFIVMKITGTDLQRISLGALVIALGLLVDDAIIAAEMMVVKLEQGWDRYKAATYAYTSTAWPMLTGTLITVAGFAPIGFAHSVVGEYIFSLFSVIGIALVSSWFVAVIFTPYLGYRLLDPPSLMAKAASHGGDIYNTFFYRRFRALVTWCVRHRWRVIMATLAAFAIALAAFVFGVEKQFFPPADRFEVMVQVTLPEGASPRAVEAEVQRIEESLRGDPAVLNVSSYLGNGAPRFYLTMDQQLFADNFAEIVINTPSIEAREAVKGRLETRFGAANGALSAARVRIFRLENGPPVGFPVQFRVLGEDISTLRAIAGQVRAVMDRHPRLVDVNLNWNEKIKSIRVEIDQARARHLGVSTREVAQALKGWQQGTTLTRYREDDQLIEVLLRAPDPDRGHLDRLPDLQVVTADGRHLPVAQVARLVPVLEEGAIWRRERLPAITVRADMTDGALPTEVTAEVNKALADVRQALPSGYRIELGGSVEGSQTAEKSIAAVVPFVVLAILTLLMAQLKSLSRSLLVLLTAPLGMVGVSLALLVFQVPFGFVANLGVIALAGMIMRNSVILVDQIEQDEAAGKSRWEAIIGSTVRRFRPIVLTATAAVLAMIPLTRQVFWGPMAVAIMGGLVVA